MRHQNYQSVCYFGQFQKLHTVTSGFHGNLSYKLIRLYYASVKDKHLLQFLLAHPSHFHHFIMTKEWNVYTENKSENQIGLADSITFSLFAELPFLFRMAF